MHRAAEIDELPVRLGRIHLLFERGDLRIGHAGIVHRWLTSTEAFTVLPAVGR